MKNITFILQPSYLYKLTGLTKIWLSATLSFTNRSHMLLALWLPLIAITVFITSCKKSVDPLPSETAIGANTFGCKVNGVAYIPSGGDPTISWYPVQGGWYLSGSDRGLYITTTSSNNKFIDIYIKVLDTVGVYKLNYNTQPFPIAVYAENYGYYATKNANGTRNRYVTNNQFAGEVNVKQILPGGIIAGTFNFTAYNQQTGETVTITEGRFDVKN